VQRRLGQGNSEYPPTRWWSGLARLNQLPPDQAWQFWLILAGRGFGKSRAVNEWAIEQARRYPGSRGALVAATAGDVRDVVVEGESGILNIATPDFMPVYEPSKRRLTFPNGSIATTFSADQPRALRGPQFHWAICDELAAWRYIDAFDMLLMGTRLGDDPRIAISTTPRPIKVIKNLLKDPTCIVTRGSTYENRANLAPTWFDKIITRFEGTSLGRQELQGDIVDAIEGALWQRQHIDGARIDAPPDLQRVVVAIDPAVTATEDSDETGIVVGGIALVNGVLHGYVLDDISLRASPEVWARCAVNAYHDYAADRLVAETNNGGDMVKLTIRTVDRNVSYKDVHASRGKATRAEPIAALYEQGRIHHCGVFPALEDQMCSWIPGDKNSPDRVDALVWCLSELMLKQERRDVQTFKR
jgi:phage terminase large subunit-like protein